MKSKYTLAAMLAATVMLGAQALADDIFYRTIELSPTLVGQLTIPELGVGDEVHLTLVNRSDQALTFHTSQSLGMDDTIIVPAHSSSDLHFTYTTPFSDSVNFAVMDPAGANIATGMLFDRDLFDDPLDLGDDVFPLSLTLTPGMNRITLDDLGVGDTVVLTLNNPSSEDLWFEINNGTTRDRWLIPANTRRNVAYEYNVILSDDINYMVSRASDNTSISTGTFYVPPAAPVPQESAMPVETRQSVRGFW